MSPTLRYHDFWNQPSIHQVSIARDL